MRRYLFLLLILTGALVRAAAAVAAPPPGVPDQKQELSTSGGYTFYSSTWRAQTFTAGNFSAPETRHLVRITLDLENTNCPEPLVVEIREANGDQPGVQVLASTERADVGARDKYDFVFNNAVITANQKYAVVCHIKNDAGTYSKNYTLYAISNIYPGGAIYTSGDSGVSWNLSLNNGVSDDSYFITYVAHLESYQDANHTAVWGSPSAPYDAGNPTVYIGGSGFEKNVEHHLAYYDGAGQRIATETKTADGDGNFSGMLACGAHPNSPDGSWHVAVYKGSDLPPEGIPNTYQPEDPYVVLQDEFVVAASAIPEFPSALTGVVTAGICSLIYLFWRRKTPLRAA